MASHSTFGAFISVEPSSSSSQEPQHASIAPPKKAFSKVYHSVPTPDEEIESIQWGSKPSGPSRGESDAPTGTQTPRVNDLEMSRPASPIQDENDVFPAMQSFSNPPINRFRMVAASLLNFANGLNDSAPGALIPYMEKHYNIGYAVVSLIFVTNAIGFISAAFIVEVLRGRFGRARTYLIGQSFLTVGYVMIVCTPPYPVVVLAFFFLGVGMAINLALSNVFAANLHNATKMLGCMHGSYGIGGTIGPLVATALASKGFLFSRFYLLTLGFAAFNAGFTGWSFWNYEAETGQTLLTPLEMTASRGQAEAIPQNTMAEAKARFVEMAQSFKSKIVLLGALFIFAYQGAEVSISGWVISFLITARNGDPASVGYVTSGFWAGVTIGRFLLSHPAHKIGEKIFVYGAIIGAAAFQLIVWCVPNVIGNAVALCIVGLLLGPIYPCATVIFSQNISRKAQVSGLSVISAFGSSGGAVAPFTTGILAQAVGTFVLHPIAIGLFGMMIVCWFCIPNPKKRTV